METLKKQLDQIQRLRDVHLECYLAYRNFEEMAKFRAPNVVGLYEAKRNAKAIGDFKYFFNSAIRSMNYAFLMHLSRLYIGGDSLTLRKLLNTIKQNRTTIADYRELHKDQPELLASSDSYVAMDDKDFLKAEEELERVKPIIEKLKHNRDNYLAHLDFAGTSSLDTSYEELYDLIEVADNILQLLTLKLDMRRESYHIIEQSIILESGALMTLLRRSA